MLFRFCGELPPTASLFEPIANCTLFNKPDGGLWCAPVQSDGCSTWESFCRKARLDLPSGKFDFWSNLPGLYRIDGLQDYLNLVDTFPAIDTWDRLCVDFEAMVAARRYRGVYLTEQGANNCHWSKGIPGRLSAYASLREWEIACVLWLYWPRHSTYVRATRSPVRRGPPILLLSLAGHQGCCQGSSEGGD